MANSAADIQKLYIAYFNRPADPAGLAYWTASAMTIGQIADSFGKQVEYNAAFAGQTTETIVATLYQNLFGHQPDFAGLMYWVGQVNQGKSTIGNVAINIVSGATGADATTIAAKVTAATSFTTAINTTPEATAYSKAAGMNGAKAWLSLVTSDASAASQIIKQDATIAAIVAADSGATAGGTVSLTVGQDSLTGTVGNDTMVANVVQNSLGQQVNTLGSGDILNGGAGKDTLDAKITSGAYVNGSGTQTMPIQPETKGVELIKLQAVNAGITDAGPNTNVFVNAKNLQGVDKIASNYSDANLIVQNMTTKDDSGNARTLSKLTVGMEYTGNQDTNWKASDLSVYFDQDYLNPDITFTNPSIDFQLMNEDAYDATVGTTSFRPLDAVYVGQMDITVNGVKFNLAPGLGEDRTATSKGNEIKTYAELLTAVQASIAALKAANPTNVPLQSLTAKLGANFTSDISPTTGLLRTGQTITLTMDGTTDGAQNTLTVKPTDLQLLRAQDPSVTLANNNRYEEAAATPSDKGQLLSINVDLEKVGLAGDGGALVIGSMFKDGTNVYKDAYIGKGIDQFDVKVSGGVAKPNSLSSMASTGNNLKVVNVTTNATQTGDFAALTIGNTVTTTTPAGGLSKKSAPSADNANALKDVKTFNASTFKGDLTLFAGLTNEVTAKYLNLKDVAAPAADNVAFTYTSGTGNDYINLHLDGSNLAAPGTSSREDMTLSVSTGEGNDTIVVKVDTTTATNWYANQKINANLAFASGVATGQLQLNGDAGNDTIRKLGSGDFAINAGLGDDTVYSDNTGKQTVADDYNEGRATWIFNTSDKLATSTNVTDALSAAAVTTASSKIVNLELTVSFRGIAKKVVVGNSMNSTVGVAVTDLMINNAIKDAINNDPVLSKLLVAEDGAARTLIVKSLIDDVGTAAEASTDVVVSLSSAALTTAQTTVGTLVLLPAADSTALGFAAAIGGGAITATGRFDSALATDSAAVVITGAESTAVTDNIIVGGMGNDVIVLASNNTGTDATASNETIAYAAGAFGNDTIVNFVATAAVGIDKLDFTALGGSGAAFAAALSTTNKSISVVGETAANDTVAEIKALYDAAGVVAARTYVYVAYDTNNIAKVYTVVDGTAAADTVVTLVGTIDLADTGWGTLVAANFV
jgi:hypothetical protein